MFSLTYNIVFHSLYIVSLWYFLSETEYKAEMVYGLLFMSLKLMFFGVIFYKSMSDYTHSTGRSQKLSANVVFFLLYTLLYVAALSVFSGVGFSSSLFWGNKEPNVYVNSSHKAYIVSWLSLILWLTGNWVWKRKTSTRTDRQ